MLGRFLAECSIKAGASTIAGQKPRTDDDFDAAWAKAEPVKGWLTRDQGIALWNAALCLGPGDAILEIGSHQGRSTIVLGSAARVVGAHVIAVDPFVDGKLFGGQATRTLFEDNIEAAGLGEVVKLVAGYSTELRPAWNKPFELLYIDGKHDYWTYTDDLRWSAHLPDGAEILVHDCFSSIGVTLGTIAKVLFGGRYSYCDRVASLATFRLTPPSAASRLRGAAQLPWFAWNVVIKVLLRLRLRGVAAVVGHRSPYDPY